MNGPEELDRLPEVEGREREALETALRQALCPVQAPSGFADSVLRRAGLRAEATAEVAEGGGLSLLGHDTRPDTRSNHRRESQRAGLARLLPWPTAHLQGWGAGALAAAALALAVFAGEQNHLKRDHERDLAERRAAANQQFEAAVRITDETVEQIQARTREHLRRVGATGIE